jgi:hypothetical protein
LALRETLNKPRAVIGSEGERAIAEVFITKRSNGSELAIGETSPAKRGKLNSM